MKKRQYYKTNAIFRSILLEPGKHRLEFVFGPKAVAAGLWLSGVTFLGLAVLFGGRHTTRMKSTVTFRYQKHWLLLKKNIDRREYLLSSE